MLNIHKVTKFPAVIKAIKLPAIIKLPVVIIVTCFICIGYFLCNGNEKLHYANLNRNTESAENFTLIIYEKENLHFLQEAKPTKMQPVHPSYILQSKSSIKQYAENLYLLEEPFLQTFANDGVSWHINAKQAKVMYKNQNAHEVIDSILLTGDVIMHKYLDNKLYSQITGEELRYTPATHQLTSKKQVTIKEPDYILSGKNMHGNIKQHTFKIEEDLKITHNTETKTTTQNIGNLEITAHTGSWEKDLNLIVFTGNVLIKNKDYLLYADQATFHLEPKQQANRPYPDSKQQIKFIHATGNLARLIAISKNTNLQEGKAKNIKFYPQKDDIEFIQNASVTTRNHDMLCGHYLKVNLKTHDLISSGTYNNQHHQDKSSSLNQNLARKTNNLEQVVVKIKTK